MTRSLSTDAEWIDYARQLVDQGKLTQAIEALETALHTFNNSAVVHWELASLLRQTSEIDRALIHFEWLFKRQLLNLGGLATYVGVLITAGAFNQAQRIADHGMAIAPTNPLLLHNYVMILEGMQQYHDAIRYAKMNVRTNPSYINAQIQLAHLLLKTDQFSTGFHYFNARFHKPDFEIKEFPYPKWEGQCILDKTLLVHQEQGFGDVMLMTRFLPLVKERVGRIIFVCHPVVSCLFTHLQPAIPVEIVNQLDPTCHIDYFISLMSIPNVMGISKSLILSLPTFHLPNDAVCPDILHWISDKMAGRRIGLVWRGNSNPLPLSVFEPVIKQFSHWDWISLQCDPTEEERSILADNGVRDASAFLKNFLNTAGFIHCLDGVVSVDTSVANCCGCLNERVWVPLSVLCDWRWGIESTHTIWYPSARLVRQNNPSDWRDVMDELIQCLWHEMV